MVTRKVYMVIEHGVNDEYKPCYDITCFESAIEQSIFFDDKVKKLEKEIIKLYSTYDLTEEELHAIGNRKKTHPFINYDISEDKVEFIDGCGPKAVAINKDSMELIFHENKKIWEV